MQHINDYTLEPARLHSLQPGGHPQLEAGSEGRQVGWGWVRAVWKWKDNLILYNIRMLIAL